MGFESFQIMLRGGRTTYAEANEAIHKLPTIEPDESSFCPGTYYLMKDGRHVLEVELMDVSPIRVSCRFTLCHPASVDAAFLGFVRELMDLLGMDAEICDEIPAGHAHKFSLDSFSEFSTIARQCIAKSRAEWIAYMGAEQLSATTDEVFARIILPFCKANTDSPQ